MFPLKSAELFLDRYFQIRIQTQGQIHAAPNRRCRDSSVRTCQQSLAMWLGTSSSTMCPSSTASTTLRRSAHPFRPHYGIMANMVLCVIPGQGNSKILNLVKSGSFDSPIFLYIPNDEKTSTGHLIWPQPFIWQPFLEISCPGMTLWI